MQFLLFQIMTYILLGVPFIPAMFTSAPALMRISANSNSPRDEAIIKRVYPINEYYYFFILSTFRGFKIQKMSN